MVVVAVDLFENDLRCINKGYKEKIGGNSGGRRGIGASRPQPAPRKGKKRIRG